MTNVVRGIDKLGDPVDVLVMHAEAQPILSRERHAESDKAKREKLAREKTEGRIKLLDATDAAWTSGQPLSPSALEGKVGGASKDVRHTRNV